MLRKLSVTCLEIYFCEVDVRNVKNAKHNIWSLEYPIFSRAAVAARGGGGDDDNGELKWKLLCSRAKVGVGGDTPDTFFRVNSFSGMEILMPSLGAMKILKFP